MSKSITIAEFCSQYNVTEEERIKLAGHLISLRSQDVLMFFGIDLKKRFRKRIGYVD